MAEAKITTDHDEIRRWVEARGGHPARVKGTNDQGSSGVAMGRLAEQRAADPSVKEFGQRMITDHSRAGAELKTIAANKNIQLPADVDSSQKSTMDRLSKLSGAEFDKEYMSEMVNDHEADAKEFQTQANEGNDADIKRFAAKTLPLIQEHLQMARGIAKKVEAK